jgi:RimJ/RimL family protein N-acetyltransferase
LTSRFSFPDPALTDGVVRVRRIDDGDVDALVTACRDPLIKRFTSAIPDPYREADARHWIAVHERNLEAEVPLGVEEVATGAFAGTTGLHSAVWHHRRADVGYWTAPEARGRGLTARALTLVVEWAFAEFDLVRIGLYCDVENVASQRVAEAAGFAREGVHRKFLVLAGEPRDCVAYGNVRD